MVAFASLVAALVAACGDSTEPMKPLASSYVLTTIDANPVPFVYANSGSSEFPSASRYVARTIKHVTLDTFVVSEVMDVLHPTDNQVLGYRCTQYDVALIRSGRYIIFKYYVRDPTPTAPSVGGMGAPVQFVVKYDTLTVDGDELVQITTAIPGRVSRLVFRPGVATASCPSL